ncbi:MAG TPA: isoprenylcysteine carboxylmethyltransferase family protein [Candidatus Acidoferrum sp.]|nr:isoprenylcysteine carboxylmethyltransferase family protein [Candidatus Acidoferrum sp.]
MNKQRNSSRNPIRLLLHIPVPWVFVLTYGLGAGLEFMLRPYPRTDPPRVVAAAGAVLLASGAAIAAWSLLIFHKAGTTTVPGRTSSSLITRGPYRFSRNPMYVGLVLAYLGEAGILKQVWPVVLLPMIVVYLSRVVIPVEEARLTEVFGAEYEHYRATVRRWL